MYIKRILFELYHHIPFTFLGAFTGILIAIPSSHFSYETSYRIFYILHPLHVVFSALVTASIYKLHNPKKFWMFIIVGYVGSIGVATLSDSIIPYLGETLLEMPNRDIHIGFIEKWWLINPLALIGIAIAYFRPATKIPHSGHVHVLSASCKS